MAILRDAVLVVWRGLLVMWRNLYVGALALRPLPQLSTDARVLQRLPGWGRRAVSRLPHAALVALAGVLIWGSWKLESDNWWEGGTDLEGVFVGLAAALPLLLLLFRPLAAWWLSLALIFAVAPYSWLYPWPWTETGLTSHLVIMVIVAVRSPLATAVGMWLVATVTASVATEISDRPLDATNVPLFAGCSAVALTVALLIRGLTSARREVVAKDEITVIERSKRTVLEERTTIARELHDVVAHHMSVIAIQAEAAPYRMENVPPELVKSFATIRENAVAALAELRRVLGVIRISDYELYDAPEAPQPTLDVLDGLLANVRQAGLPVEKVITGARRELPQGVELSAFRIIQEGLSNVLRHAPGAETRVELAYVSVGLGVRIVNGPVVADAVPETEPGPPGPGSGHGITGMRERVAMLDGELTTGATADGGYEVVAFLPASAVAEETA
ncbi:two-component sensor histidine kinase [Streptomyces sp. A7024]|uniref:histidine kinase n=2 Tax=Streptomyces coryli TaxID=1128680 RepID=A0A6G4U6M9_9ACTN|nr:histidine kinase [Streptomyces coryli]NGN66851.1 two-component sensor histidine kinase [Streptomyces coryli]